MHGGILAPARGVLLAVVALALLQVELPAYAKKPSPCDRFGVQAAGYMKLSFARGYPWMAQPLASTKAASDAKIEDFRNFLGTMEAQVNAWNLHGCPAWEDAKEAVDDGKILLAKLLGYTGPWGPPELGLPSNPASVSNYFEIDLPCRTGKAPAALRPCKDLIKDFTTRMEEQVKNQVNLAYHGGFTFDMNTKSIVPKGSGDPVCNPRNGMTGVANLSPELSSNLFGGGCGNWATFGTHRHGSTCDISNPSGSIGTFPNGQVMGMNIRAMDCHWGQIKNELARGKLRLSAATGLDPRQKYDFQLNGDPAHPEFPGLIKAKASFLASENIDAIDLCDKSLNTNDPKVREQPGFLSACKLQGQREQLEAQYLGLAMIEWNDRAQRSYDRAFLGTKGRDFFVEFNFYLNMMRATQACQGKKNDCNSNTYLKKCVIPNWNDFYAFRTDPIWTPGVCQ